MGGVGSVELGLLCQPSHFFSFPSFPLLLLVVEDDLTRKQLYYQLCRHGKS